MERITPLEFQFKMFVKGKELWGHLGRSSRLPLIPSRLIPGRARMFILSLGY
jgi:hypothetical protein